jgi:predicted amidohydrolase
MRRQVYFWVLIMMAVSSVFLFACQVRAEDLNGVLKVAAIKHRQADANFKGIIDKINRFLLSHGDVDLIVIPEYTLYPAPNAGYSLSRPYAVEIRATADGYKVFDTGTVVSRAAVTAITQIQEIAKNFRTNIALGTIAEMKYKSDDEKLGGDIIFNTMLIIDRDGKIAGLRRKVTGSDSLNYDLKKPCNTDYAHNLALGTVQPFYLKTREGKTFSIFPVICAENSSPELLGLAKAFSVELLVISAREGDFPYERITKDIQTGALNPAGSDWQWLKKDFLDPHVTMRDIVQEGGYLIAADSGSSANGSGIIQLNDPPEVLACLDITQEYVYAKINFHFMPFLKVLDRGQWTNNKFYLSARLILREPGADIRMYRYKATQDSPNGPIIVQDWTSLAGGARSIYVYGQLQEGKTYFLTVQYRDASGWRPEMFSTDGITVDTLRPNFTLLPQVPNSVAKWAVKFKAEASDDRSGIDHICVHLREHRAMQLSMSDDDFVFFLHSGVNYLWGFDLKSGKTYTYFVRAKDLAGNFRDTPTYLFRVK